MKSSIQAGLADKLQRVEQNFNCFYGMRVWCASNYIDDLVGALVATVLSQNTSDLNSGRAYASLKSAFPGGWDDVRLAPVEEIIEAIRPGGLAQVKGPRIQFILNQIYALHERVSLDHLKGLEDAEVNEYLRSYKGVGPKTAACILMFNMGRNVLAVDTHVHRVALRLGLIGRKISADQAHDLLQSLLSPTQAYSFHVHMIEHGRRICHARSPKCFECPQQHECDYLRKINDWAGA